MNYKQFWDKLEQLNVQLVDLRFTDTLGKEHHISVPRSMIDENFMKFGKAIDGSSIKGWRQVNESDLTLIPDPTTLVLDPFYKEPTALLRCSVYDPKTLKPYPRDPRFIAKQAVAYMQKTGIADKAYLGPECEFFVFDDVRWHTGINGCFYEVDSIDGTWNSKTQYQDGNKGHRNAIKGGYFPVPPVDSTQDLRSEITMTLQKLGIIVEAHHHEVATGNQCEVAVRYDELLKKADDTQLLKYVVHNVANQHGRTATFMPKPLMGDNGSGMHCHISLSKDDKNLFAGNEYANLSKMALYFIGGIIKHAKSLNIFTNPSVNSYRRLLPGFEAPVLLAYSAMNRSAAIRIPHVDSDKARRIEIRFPDNTANPYLAFAAILMAGLDGINNKINPGKALEHDLYELPQDKMEKIPVVCASLEEAIESCKLNNDFLLAGGVFTKDFLKAYLDLRKQESDQMRLCIHPQEFARYYSL
jgi:glutamine synthetase